MSTIDDWIRKIWCIYTMEYYSAIKKDDIMPFAATWMELEINVLSKVSQRKINIMTSLICGIKKNDTMKLFTK